MALDLIDEFPDLGDTIVNQSGRSGNQRAPLDLLDAFPDLAQHSAIDQVKSMPNAAYQGLRKGFLGGARQLTAPIMESGLFGEGLAEQSRKHGQEIEQDYQQAKQQNPNTAGLFNVAGQAPYWALGGRAAKPAIRAGINQLRPSTHLARFGEQYSPEMAERARVAGQTPTPLGDVIGSGPLKRTFENKLPGVDPILTELEQEIVSRGQDLAKPTKGVDPNEALANFIQKQYKQETGTKNSLYAPVNELARKEKFALEFPTASATARKNIKALEESPMLKNDADFASKVRKLFNVANPKEIVPAKTNVSPVLDKSGNPIVKDHTPEKIRRPSIVEAKQVANKLYSEGKRLMKNPESRDRAVGGLYSRVSKEIRDDIRNQINQKGSTELKDAYKKAEKNYKNSFANYLDKNIYPYVSDTKDAESIIRQIVKPGKLNDKFRSIEKLNKILPADQKGMLGQAYLQSAINKYGDFDVKELSARLRALGPRQFRNLFTPEQQSAVKDFDKFSRMNSEALNRLFNPHTGKRTADQANAISEAMSAALFGGAGAFAGGPTGAIVSLLARPAFKGAKDALMRKWLTDPGMREAVLKAKQAKLP